MTIEYLIYNNNLIQHHPNVSTNILIKYINMGIYVSDFVAAYYNVCEDALQHNISISHTYQYNNLETFEKTIPFCHIKILTFLHNILFPNIPSLNFINPLFLSASEMSQLKPISTFLQQIYTPETIYELFTNPNINLQTINNFNHNVAYNKLYIS